MRNLVFASITFHISQEEKQNLWREQLYLQCFTQLLRVIPENFDIVYCDNSVAGIQELLLEPLRQFLSGKRIFFLDRNIGGKNIGMGELDELIYTSEQVDFKQYDKIVYLTSRRIIANPWIFEKVNGMVKKALISNPDFIVLSSGNVYVDPVATEGLYNDMFFAMDSPTMLEYIAYSRENIQKNLTNGIGSEQNLYNFIKSKEISYEWLSVLGLIRVDYKRGNEVQLF